MAYIYIGVEIKETTSKNQSHNLTIKYFQNYRSTRGMAGCGGTGVSFNKRTNSLLQLGCRNNKRDSLGLVNGSNDSSIDLSGHRPLQIWNNFWKTSGAD